MGTDNSAKKKECGLYLLTSARIFIFYCAVDTGTW